MPSGRSPGPKLVLAYLARYTHRVAISNSRLIKADETGVTFGYKDYRVEGPGRYKTMTVAPGEFIRRFMLHVLPKGFHRIRHYGLLASSRAKADTIAAGARADRRSWQPPQPPRPAKPDEATCRHRGDRQADPSLPVLRWSHDHHRDVRGGLRAATTVPPRRRPPSGSTRHDADCTSITRQCCWAVLLVMSGNDDARPQSLSGQHATDLERR